MAGSQNSWGWRIHLQGGSSLSRENWEPGLTCAWWSERWHMACPAQRPGSWTTYVAAQGSSVNVPAGNIEAAWPVMAWPWQSHGITSTVVTSLSTFRAGDRDPPFNGRNAKKKKCSHILNSPYSSRRWPTPGARRGVKVGRYWVPLSRVQTLPSPSCSYPRVHLPLFCLVSPTQGLQSPAVWGRVWGGTPRVPTNFPSSVPTPSYTWPPPS